MIRLEDKTKLLTNSVVSMFEISNQIHANTDKKIKRLQHDINNMVLVAITLALCNLITVLMIAIG